MTSMKLITLAALIVAATGSPLLDAAIGVLNNGSGDKGDGSLISGIVNLFGGLQKNKLGSGSCFDNLAKAKQPESADDLLDLFVNLGSGLGVVADVNLVPGLEDLVSKIVTLSIKLCVRDQGQVVLLTLSKTRSYGICNKNINGIGPVGDDSVEKLMEDYDLTNAKDQTLKLINEQSNGKGLDYYSGSEHNLLDVCLKLAGILNVDISVGSLADILDQLLIGVGSVGNSWKGGSGNDLVTGLLGLVDNLLGGLLGGGGCDRNLITAVIDVGTDSAPWAGKGESVL